MKTLLSKPMKKLQAFILMFALVIGNISGAAVAKAETARNGQHKVDFVNKNGTKLMNTVYVNDGNKVQKPAEMKYKVNSWKIRGGGQYNFTNQVTKDLTLVAEYGEENPAPGQYETGKKTPRLNFYNVNYNNFKKSLTLGYQVYTGVYLDDYFNNLHIYKLTRVFDSQGHPVVDSQGKPVYTKSDSNSEIPFTDKPDYLAGQSMQNFWIKYADFISIYKYEKFDRNTAYDFAFLMQAPPNYKTVLITVQKAKGERKLKFTEYFDEGYKYQTQYNVNFVDENNQSLAETQKVIENDKVKDPQANEVSYWYVKGENSKTVYDFTKPVTGDLTLVGVKEQKIATVTFAFKSAGAESLPEAVTKLKPDNKQIPYGTKNYKPEEPAKTEVKVKGDTWKFTGWNPDNIAEVNSDLDITGIWECKHADVKITFKAKSDTENMYLPDEISGIMPNDESCAYGADYTIQPLTQLEVVDSPNSGVWKFQGWSLENSDEIIEKIEKIDKNTTLVGHWKFTPKGNVTINLKFESQNQNESLPEAVTKLLLINTDSVRYGGNYNPDKHNPKLQKVIVAGGIWHFKGWTPQEAKNVKAETTFTGNWQFEKKKPVKISFEFKSISDGKNLPDKVAKLADKEAPFGTTYRAPEIENKKIVTDDGEVWEFAGWEQDQLELTQDEVKFTGKWKFTGLKYTVQYYNEGSEVTPLASAELQTDENCKVGLANIDKTVKLENTYKFSKITYKGEDKNPTDSVTLDKANRVIKLYYKKNTTKLTITKAWKDIDTSKQRTPNEIKVDVLRRVKATDKAEYVCTDFKIDKDNNWTATLNVDIQPKDLNNNDYTYIITEHPLPGFVPVYEKNHKDGEVAVKDNDGNLSAEVVNVSDITSYVDLTVVKTDEADNKLSGAVFRMEKGTVDSGVFTKDNSYVREITTAANGTVTFRLMEGIYKLTEEIAPKGYMIDENVYYILVNKPVSGLEAKLYVENKDPDKEPEESNRLTLTSSSQDDDGGHNCYELSIVNKKINDNSIYKTDQNGKAVVGAKFDLYKKMSDDNTYPMFVEVDNSQIGGEQFNVTAQLYEIADNEEQVGENKALSDTEQNNVFDGLSKDKQYQVKFTFDGRFTATVSYDKDTNTVTLHLMPKANSGDIIVDNADNNSNDNAVSPSTTSVIPENETSTDNSADVAAENTAEVTADVTENLPEVTAEVDENNGTNVQDANKPDNASDKQADAQILGNPAVSSVTAESEIITLQTAENHQGFVKIRTDITSGDDGEINLGVLEEGEYYLKETQAPTKAGGKYEMTDDVFYFNITAEGEITLPVGSAIKENNSDTGVFYSIVNNWTADAVPENNGGSNPDGNDGNSSSDGTDSDFPFINPYVQPEVSDNDSKADKITEDDIPLTDSAAYVEDEDVVKAMPDKKKSEDIVLSEEDIPLADVPKTGEETTRYLFTALLSGGLLILLRIADSLKKRR